MSDEINTSAEVAEADVLPRMYEVHADGSRCDDRDLPAAGKSRPVNQKSPAEWAYERLILYIRKFEEMLDSEHEVAMGLTGADAGVMRIEGMGFFDPDILTFYGSDMTGNKTQQVQHVSQLNVMLRAVTKTPDAPEPNRIGFQLVQDLAKSDASDSGS